MTVDKPFVITIVGAESSGKTTLAMKLAEYFDCPWVPEYAREYLEGLERPYNEEDLGVIASRQLEEISRQLAKSNEQLAISNRQMAIDKKQLKESGQSKYLKDLINHIKSLLVTRYSLILVVDGGMMNLRLWARLKYKSIIPKVEKALENDVTDLYILCRPLNEWEPDPLREAPSIIDRVWIYNQYLDELSRSKINLEILGGIEIEKFNKAVIVIEKLFKGIADPTT